MTIATAKLNLLTFPQNWTGGDRTLTVRFLLLPKGDPLQPLANGLRSFAAANFVFEARLINSLASAPGAGEGTQIYPLTLTPSPTMTPRETVFRELAKVINIDTKPVPPRGARPQYRKPATDSYRTLTGDRLLSKYMVDGKGYECALNSSHETQPPQPEVIPTSLRWGQVIALALRQPNLAMALGLIGETRIVVPAGVYSAGGWLYIALHSTSDGASTPNLTALHAARIPVLKQTEERAVYTPVLFPVGSPNLILDDIYRDAERYDRGYARLVHGQQNVSATTEGDTIQLAWDDEQLAEWLNRQLDPANAAPMGTAGYRVDVRDVTTATNPTPWNSLQRVTSKPLVFGKDVQVNLGTYTGEGMVEVVPTRVARNAPTEFWMPPYFATWRGTSLVLTDKDLKRLHKNTVFGSTVDPATRLLYDDNFEPVGDAAVPLRYGRKYEFRVRMADLTCGGPKIDATMPTDADAHHTAAVTFRRRKPPGPTEVKQRPARGKSLKVVRPRLAYPEILYTSAGRKFEDLENALQADKLAKREVGLALPDPDVVDLEITAQVRALSGDRVEWHKLYTVTRKFPADTVALDLELNLNVDFKDVATLAGYPRPADTANLTLPTARDVRLVLVALGRTDANYFVDAQARIGPPVTVDLHVKATASAEGELFPTGPLELVSSFLRQPPPDGSVAQPVERLANELGLDHHGLTLAGRAKRRTVFGCSERLRHTLSPEASAITLSSDADVTQQWIHALRFRLARDWTWRGLAPDGITISRKIKTGTVEGTWQVVGTVTLPRALSPNAIKDVGDLPNDEPRRSTDIVFLDAHDPKPSAAAQYPDVQTIVYRAQPTFEQGPGIARDSTVLTLPVTTPPSQVPRLLSAGIALQELKPGANEFTARRAALWLEFAEAPRDPLDAYYVRPLVAAPDPLLIDVTKVVVPETVPEPALPIDPEWIRTIRVNQPRDNSGALAMQPLPRRADQVNCFLVPLPEGIDASSPELFNMYTYEIRVGHDDRRYCTANGRWGPTLRISGVKHPPPPLMCQASRNAVGVLVRAPFATATLNGRHVRPDTPKTQLWTLIYARVQQADATAWRYVPIGHAQLAPPARGLNTATVPSFEPPTLLGELIIPNDPLRQRLQAAGLPDDTDLAVLAIEVFTEPAFPDPLGFDLGHAPFMRTSALVRVPEAC